MADKFYFEIIASQQLDFRSNTEDVIELPVEKARSFPTFLFSI